MDSGMSTQTLAAIILQLCESRERRVDSLPARGTKRKAPADQTVQLTTMAAQFENATT